MNNHYLVHHLANASAKNGSEIESYSRAIDTIAHILKRYYIFFHPDYTVGFGISPNHALRLVGYTTGREFPAYAKSPCPEDCY